MTTAGHCHEDHSAPPEQRGEQREPQVPARAGPVVGPGHQPHWGAPCARCQKGPDKLRAGKGTEVREQGRLRLPRDRGAEPGPSRAQQERRGARTPRASREPRAGPRQGWCRPTSTRPAACAGPRGPRCVLGTRAPPEGAGPAQASPCLLEYGAPGGQEPQR